MFNKLIKQLKLRYELQTKERLDAENPDNKEIMINVDVEQNLSNLKKVFGNTNDVIYRQIMLGTSSQTKILICYIDGLVDKQKLNKHVTEALLIDASTIDLNNNDLPHDIVKVIKEKIISASEVSEEVDFNKVVSSIISGDSAIFIDGCSTVLMTGMKGWSSRNISEPSTEVTVRGPREGFTENARTNATLIRRRIKDPNLVFETIVLGRHSQTDVVIAYIRGIVNENILEEVKKRLKSIDTNYILESGYIEQFIEDHPFSSFSTIGNSEKPDKVSAKILEGRVAILCDGTPFILTVPYLFIENFQVSEDYYIKPIIATLGRGLRFFAFLITLFAPSLYVALETFHQEMVPTVLLITAAAAREGIPFPSFMETIIMIVIFEFLRESGVRMPRQVGQAVSIVGALIIGQAAVEAGIISAPMVIIGALTGISSFMVPSLLDAIFIYRLFFVGLSAVLGLYGIVVGTIIMIGSMCSLTSYGIPYMTPLAPMVFRDLKDSFIRLPLWTMKMGPSFIKNKSKND